MEPESFRVDFDGVDWQHAGTGCRFKAIVRGNRQMRLLEFTPEFVEADWCAKAHTGIVLQGELEIDFRGKVERFPEGSGICIPAGPTGAHKARAASDRVTLFLVENI